MSISLPDFTILQFNSSFIIELYQNKSFHIFSSAVYVNYKCSNLWLDNIQLDWIKYTTSSQLHETGTCAALQNFSLGLFQWNYWKWTTQLGNFSF